MIFCRCFQKIQPNETKLNDTIKYNRRNKIIKMILFINKNTIIPTN